MFDRHMLAQNSVVRLAEGETFDIGFWPDQSDSFMFYDLDEPDPVIYVIANRIYVEDSAGRRYRVKNDARCIDRLFDGEPT
ncbi:MAG: hypothetical protein LBF16_01120 [Pseudomonadales bacterium]|nr:hypothetical protein [Pseudomonadales bacterium]